MTLNYDDYIELALQLVFVEAGRGDVESRSKLGTGRINGWSYLKLHGSFGWNETWPITAHSGSDKLVRTLWIPPGIRKEKVRYPFNLVWGKARDVLNCDVLRIIGCSLVPGDWDLISLLFGTQRANTERSQPYTIEVIDSPHRAAELKRWYPYLNMRSILEIDTMNIGKELVSDLLGGVPRTFEELSSAEKQDIEDASRQYEQNWFRVWLQKMWEGLQMRLGVSATETALRAYERWLERES